MCSCLEDSVIWCRGLSMFRLEKFGHMELKHFSTSPLYCTVHVVSDMLPVFSALAPSNAHMHIHEAYDNEADVDQYGENHYSDINIADESSYNDVDVHQEGEDMDSNINILSGSNGNEVEVSQK